MILDGDIHIQETIFDNTPLSITLLKKFGWVPRANKIWMSFTKRDVKEIQITRFTNGTYYLETKTHAVNIRTVGDLRENLKCFML